MPANTKKDSLLQYKGHPLMRKDNVIYYGSMTDSHIIMMQILDSKKENGIDRIVKSSEKSSLWSAMDIASIWLDRALSTK